MTPFWLDARLARCRRVFVRRLAVPARIGVHDFERAAPQRLQVDVDLYVALEQSTPRSDALEEVVDYDFVRDTVRARIAQGHVNLQETLVDDLARTLLARRGVVAVRVASEKPEVYPDVEAVGVEVVLFKGDAG
ncbi:MAG TPA: dihydroneopterin aldolase [Burkholderiaceae bacterium]|nr:dihydroneopterin aldolase [Burkholderiaceae bacterium]